MINRINPVNQKQIFKKNNKQNLAFEKRYLIIGPQEESTEVFNNGKRVYVSLIDRVESLIRKVVNKNLETTGQDKIKILENEIELNLNGIKGKGIGIFTGKDAENINKIKTLSQKEALFFGEETDFNLIMINEKNAFKKIAFFIKENLFKDLNIKNGKIQGLFN